MGAVNYTLYIPRSNFVPGTGGSGRDKATTPPPTEAVMAGTRGPFVLDTTMWSTLKFKANSPDRTVGRQVLLLGDAAWWLTHFSAESALVNAFPVAANQTFTVELQTEDFILYVAAASASVNLRAYVTR